MDIIRQAEDKTDLVSCCYSQYQNLTKHYTKTITPKYVPWYKFQMEAKLMPIQVLTLSTETRSSGLMQPLICTFLLDKSASPCRIYLVPDESKADKIVVKINLLMNLRKLGQISSPFCILYEFAKAR